MNTASNLVASCERAWEAIQGQHPEVPDVVMVAGPDVKRASKGFVKFGHFWADRWQAGDSKVPEVLLVGEALNRSPSEVFATILHEAVHALAHARDEKDTDKTGKYHNKRFKAIGTEVGLAFDGQADKKRGWAFTHLPEETVERYTETIADLAEALVAYRRSVEPAASTPSRNLAVAVCGCPRKIRVAQSTLDEGPVTCGLCGEDFTTEV